MKDELADALSDYISEHKIRPADLKKNYSTVRRGHILALLGADDEIEVEDVKHLAIPHRASSRPRPGMRMQCAIAEALGLKVTISIEGVSS